VQELGAVDQALGAEQVHLARQALVGSLAGHLVELLDAGEFVVGDQLSGRGCGRGGRGGGLG
jgi:hypothetical protein